MALSKKVIQITSIVRYGDNLPDTIHYQMDGADKSTIWTRGANHNHGEQLPE
jgi:hypothetical protein